MLLVLSGIGALWKGVVSHKLLNAGYLLIYVICIVSNYSLNMIIFNIDASKTESAEPNAEISRALEQKQCHGRKSLEVPNASRTL